MLSAAAVVRSVHARRRRRASTRRRRLRRSRGWRAWCAPTPRRPPARLRPGRAGPHRRGVGMRDRVDPLHWDTMEPRTMARSRTGQPSAPRLNVAAFRGWDSGPRAWARRGGAGVGSVGRPRQFQSHPRGACRAVPCRAVHVLAVRVCVPCARVRAVRACVRAYI